MQMIGPKTKMRDGVFAIAIMAIVLATCGSQDRFAEGFRETAAEGEAEPDSIERDGTINDIWFADVTESVREDDTTHASRTASTNYHNNLGAGDTVKLVALKNDHPSFQTFFVNATADTVDSMEVYLDSLVTTAGAGYTIKNDSGRSYTHPYWYAGKPIEQWVMQYVATGLGEGSDTTGYDDGMHWAGWPDAQPLPVADFKGMLPTWCIPSEADPGPIGTTGQGGYPFYVAPGAAQSIGTDIYVSRDAVAGDYYGRLRVYEGGYLTHSFPVHLIVKDYTLPDFVPLMTNLFIEPTLPKYYAGKDAAGILDFIDKSAMLMKRHLFNANYESETVTVWAANDGKWYVSDNVFFSASNGYDGVGQGYPFNMGFIGTYDMPANMDTSSIDGDTTGYSSRCGWPSTQDGGWGTVAEAWADTIIRLTGEDPDEGRNVMYFYGADEMDIDRAAYNWMFTRTKLTHDGGDGDKVGWFFTMAYFDGYGGSIDQYATETEIQHWSLTSSAGYDSLKGYNVRDSVRGTYLDNQHVQNVLGHKAGYYNMGARAGFPNVYHHDVPGTEARAAFWLAKKYLLDHMWNWHTWYFAESGATYGGLQWKNPMDTSSLLNWWVFEGDTIVNHGLQDHTLVWTGVDTTNSGANDRGIDGPIPSYTLKRLRQAVGDWRILDAADSLGVNITAIMNSVVGAAFNDWENDSGWPEVYSRYYQFQPHWREDSYYYERYRRAAIDSIIARAP
jgi:hypothetical protein